MQANAKLMKVAATASRLIAESTVVEKNATRTSVEALRAAAASASAPNGSTTIQKAAFAMLASQLQREAGRLDAIALERAVIEQHRLATLVRSCIVTADQLSFLQRIAGKSSDQARVEILALIDSSTRDVAAVESAMTQLQEQYEVAQATTTRSTDQAKALELEAGALRQTPAAAGATFQNAIEKANITMKAAISARVQASQSQIAANACQAQLLLGQERTLATVATIDRLRVTLKSLDAYAANRTASVKSLGADVEIQISLATTNATALHTLIEGDVKSLYNSAQESLALAATHAGQGSSLPEAESKKSAKFAVVSAQLALAALCDTYAMAVSDAASAFEKMAAQVTGGDWSGYASACRTERDQALTKESEALESVISSMPVSSDPVNKALRERVDVAKTNISKRLPAASTTEAAQPTSQAPASDAPTPASPPTDPVAEPAANPAATPPAFSAL